MQVLGRDGWRRLPWADLAAAIHQELTLLTGQNNPEFVEQVTSSRDTLAALLAARPAIEGRRHAPGALGHYLHSEQSLTYGHRRHPTPKARTGRVADVLRWSPEAGASFALRWLAVRDDRVRSGRAWAGADDALDAMAPAVPSGYRALPVHPWQWELLCDAGRMAEPLLDGSVRDLGPVGPAAVPTASVRTVLVPDHDVFLKLSLDVRITNCVRKNSAYELTGAVTLTQLLAPLRADLALRHPDCVIMAEPAYRTYDAPDRPDLVEGLGLIVREGLGAHMVAGTTALLAAALADEHATGPTSLQGLLNRRGASPAAALHWWETYVSLVVPPVLHAWFGHGVAFEPHLQNVVVAVDDQGIPVRVLLRDMEGTKLREGSPITAGLADVPPEVRDQLTYDAARGWNRVVYCLVVNHLAEVLAGVADHHPALERALWGAVRDELERYRRDGNDSSQLRALLSGVPLPGKANLLTRWRRDADRHADYAPVPSPFVCHDAESGVRAGGRCVTTVTGAQR